MSTYARHSRTPVQSGYTGAEAAHEILRQAGITNVDIVGRVAKGGEPLARAD